MAGTDGRTTTETLDTCLTCENEAKTRGLCSRCYQAALRAIRSGTAEEQDLVDRGLLLPSRQGQPRQSNPWVSELKKQSN